MLSENDVHNSPTWMLGVGRWLLDVEMIRQRAVNPRTEPLVHANRLLLCYGPAIPISAQALA